MSLAEVKSFLSAVSLRYNHWFYLMGRSRMGFTSDWTIYLTGLMVSPGVMSHLGHAAVLWTRTTSVLFIMLFIQSCLFKAMRSQEEARKTVLLLFHMNDLLCSRVFSSGGYYKGHPSYYKAPALETFLFTKSSFFYFFPSCQTSLDGPFWVRGQFLHIQLVKILEELLRFRDSLWSLSELRTPAHKAPTQPLWGQKVFVNTEASVIYFIASPYSGGRKCFATRQPPRGSNQVNVNCKQMCL